MTMEAETSQAMKNHTANVMLAAIETFNHKIYSMDANINSLDLKVGLLEGSVFNIGESDPDAYFTWDSSHERIFQVNDIIDEKKSTIAHFEGYAIIWWKYAKRFGNALNDGEPTPWNTLNGLIRQRKVVYLEEKVGLEDEYDEKAYDGERFKENEKVDKDNEDAWPQDGDFEVSNFVVRRAIIRGNGNMIVLPRMMGGPTDCHYLNLRSNSFQDGEDGTIRISSKPFTRSQDREFQGIQGLFMKHEVLNDVFLPSRGCHLMLIALTLDQGSLEESREWKMGLEGPLEGTCTQSALDLPWTCSSISRVGQNSPKFA
ncbi:hypothetical protein FXO38_29259 [Capsicum annuum]|uniref:Uncharacterized protein n=1 Tax=Capsicum annuum TaxID=4072 RepID=A0A2G2Z9D3_CAPAN|nr:hypothetical protein FXO38_29259 [Capsicum annuum]KAF3627817.1 hypothetical protein FXO37_29660 [Capsicum annuum]PHT78608.1 hypothetical protein T459_16660 [Capsicum annuum]